MKKYPIIEIFDTIQGEGARCGHRSVFVRFGGCNMWSGDPTKREGRGRCALWCDTDFRAERVKMMTAEQIVAAVNKEWPPRAEDLHRPINARWVVLTGGEPLLSVDKNLVAEFQKHNIQVACETNGSVMSTAIAWINWLTVSPKPPMSLKDEDFQLKVRRANEIKVVYPGALEARWWTDDRLADLEDSVETNYRYIQPRDGMIDPTIVESTSLRSNPSAFVEPQSFMQENLRECRRIIKERPGWRLSLQTHKFVGVP